MDVDFIIKNAAIYQWPMAHANIMDVAIDKDQIVAVGDCSQLSAANRVDATGLVLAPGFIDVHTHDDLEVLRNPHMLSKVSQGVTTVIAGNCGISAAPYCKDIEPVDPINLLGTKSQLRYQELAHYRSAFSHAAPSVNLAMLIGHTSLRAQVVADLTQPANQNEITRMKAMLELAMEQGALGLSSGLAYYNAKASSMDEVNTLAQVVKPFGGIYTTHLRTEFGGILDAMDEAFSTAKHADIPLVISHIKCAGRDNWGRAPEVIAHFEKQRRHQSIGCDCYPYSASSSTLDLNQVTPDTEIYITWSEPHPEMAKNTLQDIASKWQLSLFDTAKKLQPAGAVYHCMLEEDVKQFLRYEYSMIGSDGLPCDPHPHPRLWGTFPRVLGHYSQSEQTLPLALAIHKMTALPARQFQLHKRGEIKEGNYADLVLFDPKRVCDTATYSQPKQPAEGIERVWVNGKLSYVAGANIESIVDYGRAGKFLTNIQQQIKITRD